MKRFSHILFVALLGFVGVSAASQSYVDSARFEATVRQLELSIIAPCCWHQPVAKHNSKIAIEIRGEIRKMVGEGMTPEQVKAYYVRRYGERILAVPPKNAFNRLLWIIPIAASIGAFGVAGHFVRSWRAKNNPAAALPPGKESAGSSHTSFAQVDEELKKWDES